MKKFGVVSIVIMVILGSWGYYTFKKVPVVKTAEINGFPYSIESLLSYVKSSSIIVERELAEQEKYKSFIVSYQSEGTKQYALMNIPKNTKPENGWPVVVVNHGHIPPYQYSTINSYKNTAGYYASSGFLVLKPDYRGHDKSEGIATQFIFRNQYAVDVLNLIASISSVTDANPDKIFIYGHSMGADVSLQVAEVSSRIKGVTLWAPAITTYPLSITYFGKNYGPAVTGDETYESLMQKTMATYGTKRLSALENIDKVTVPIIIQHSQTDKSVPFTWGTQLFEALKKQNKNVVFYDYPNDNHDLGVNWSQALERDVIFFRSLL